VLEIDGSQKSGSGTILRLSIALAGILNEPLHIYKIRQRRPQPGLRPQHLEAVLTAAKLCNAEIKGVKIGSRELWFEPSEITGGDLHAEIGTAGSIPMLLLTILPLCAIAKETVRVHVIRGGTDVRHAPTINYIKHVLLPMLEQMGLETRLEVKKYGYYPKGMGEISLEVQPCSELKSLRLETFGNVEEVKGTSVCTFLAERKVAERQAKTASKILKTYGYEAPIEVVNDTSNPLQKGSSLVLWAKTSTNALLGGDAIGEIRKPSEAVGREAAENLVKEIKAEATVDVHLADMLVPYVALAKGESAYLCRRMTEHLNTNVWLAQKILDITFRINKVGGIYKIKKV
jgi:RNA 3'-phosphate cyclase